MQKVPRFVQWIYGEEGAPEGVDSGRLQAWAQAFETWLEGSTSSAQRRMRLYAWRSFLQYLGKTPWQASTADVDAWAEAERRAGSSDQWVLKRLRHLASFYDLCQAAGCDQDSSGEPLPLQVPAHNPARGAKKPNFPGIAI